MKQVILPKVPDTDMPFRIAYLGNYFQWDGTKWIKITKTQFRKPLNKTIKQGKF